MPQHLAALENANRIRFARARLKERVREGVQPIEEVIAKPPEYAQRMTVAELLRAQVRWGPGRTRKLCASLALSERRTLGNLTARQRHALCVAVREKRSEMEKAAEKYARAKATGKQLQFDGMAEPEETAACPECVRHVPLSELRGSLWGMCKQCENARLSV